jgi:hypothetical protein
MSNGSATGPVPEPGPLRQGRPAGTLAARDRHRDARLAVGIIAGLALLLVLLVLWWFFAGGSTGLGAGAGPTSGKATAVDVDAAPASGVLALGTTASEERRSPASALAAARTPDADLRLMSGAVALPSAPPAAEGAEGRLGTGDISFRLLWRPPLGDFDLHVTDPLGHVISHSHRLCSCGGEMDRDDTTSGGPENVFWPAGKAPRGTYTYLAEWYAGAEPVTLVLQVYRGRARVEEHTARLAAKGQRTEAFTYRLE